MSTELEDAERLRRTIAEQEYRHHVLRLPGMTSRRYFSLRRRLAELERAGTVPRTLDSPSLRVPADRRAELAVITDGPEAAPARTVASLEALRQVLAESSGTPFFVGARVQGAALRLTYRRGRLAGAALRRGETWLDVTDNARTIGAIPLGISDDASVRTRIVWGRVAMARSTFAALERERLEAGVGQYGRIDAAASAALFHPDPRVAASRALTFVATDSETPHPTTGGRFARSAFLERLGFRVCGIRWLVYTPEELDVFVDGLSFARQALAENLADLLVCADDDSKPVFRLDLSPHRVIGDFCEHVPAVGRSGGLLPRVLVETPAGGRVTYALAAVDAGGFVACEPGAPVCMDAETVDSPPIVCPACERPLSREDDEPFPRCAHLDCYGRRFAMVAHLLGRRGLDLPTLPTASVLRLLDGRPVRLDQIMALDPEEIDKVLPGAASPFEDAVDRLRRLELWRFFYLSPVFCMSERSARLIASSVRNMNGLIHWLQVDAGDFSDVDPRPVDGLRTWLNAGGATCIEGLRSLGVEFFGEPDVVAAPLRRRRVALDGTFNKPSRREVAHAVERLGGRIDVQPGALTDFLVQAENPKDGGHETEGGVAILDVARFIAVIESAF